MGTNYAKTYGVAVGVRGERNALSTTQTVLSDVPGAATQRTIALVFAIPVLHQFPYITGHIR